MKHLLFIAPLPPPYTGQSFISEHLYNQLKKSFRITVVNYARETLKTFIFSNMKQLFKIFFYGIYIFFNRKKFDAVYINLSGSFFGNLKDIFLLCSLGSFLRKKTIAHIHTAAFFEYLNKSNFFIKLINKKIFKEIYCFLVLADKFKNEFSNFVSVSKIIKVNNFFPSEIKISKEEFEKKWEYKDKINILFLSNMLPKKGYLDLLNAFKFLDNDLKRNFKLFFAGNFYDNKLKKVFLNFISNEKEIFYFSFLEGEKKIKIIKSAHALFLPSYYSEGQPVCILEAFAAGLVVFTVSTGGIEEIFKDNINGRILIKEKDYVLSIKNCIEDLYYNFEKYKKIALHNLNYSANFSEDLFYTKIDKIFYELFKIKK